MELVLNSYGASLSRDNEGFIIVNQDGKQRIPTDGIRSIQISRGAQITSDAVMLAVEKEIEVIFTDKGGNVIGRIWSPKYGSVSTIRKGQLNFTFSHEAVNWIKSTITKKMENQQALLLMMKTDDPATDKIIGKSISKINDYRNKVSALDGEVVSDIAATLRGWEGQASKIYFNALNTFIPQEYRFEQRTQRPAMDVANALLNYG